MNFMNGKIIIPISVIITIVIVAFSLTQNEIIEDQISPEINDSPEMMDAPPNIQDIYEKIEEDKIKNSNSEQPYFPSERQWIKSGPFQIDRSEYVLGEKMFINIIDLDYSAKGEMQIVKIVDSTNIFKYKIINFDGSNPQQNFYISFDLFEMRGICTVDQLIGDWEIRFVGDKGEFEKLNFKIKNQILPGAEERFMPVC